MFNLSIYFVAVVSDDGGVRGKIPLQSPACFVSYKSWLSVHGTCNEGKPGEILSNLCGQFSGDISPPLDWTRETKPRPYQISVCPSVSQCVPVWFLKHIVFVCLQIENPGIMS